MNSVNDPIKVQAGSVDGFTSEELQSSASTGFQAGLTAPEQITPPPYNPPSSGGSLLESLLGNNRGFSGNISSGTGNVSVDTVNIRSY
jgi:hypothetical protein